MKQLRTLLCALVTLLLLASCTNTNYLKVIPAKAKVVGCVDVKALADKCELDKNHYMIETLRDRLCDQMEGRSGEELVKKIFDAPSASGIDFTEPAYLFLTPDRNYFGLALCVSDKSDLEETLDLVHKQGGLERVREKKGLMCSASGDVQIAFDGDALVFLAPTMGDRDATARRLAKLFDQDDDAPFTDSRAYKRLSDVSGDMKVYVSMSVIPAEFINRTLDDGGTLDDYMPDGLKFKDISIVSTIEMKKGCASWDYEVCGETDAAQRILEAQAAKSKKLSGKYLCMAHDNTLCWAAATTNGTDALAQITRQRSAKAAVLMAEQKLGLDLSNMLRAFGGDIAFTFAADNINAMKDKDLLDGVCVAAQVKNTAPFALNSTQLQTLSAIDEDIAFSQADDNSGLYVVTNRERQYDYWSDAYTADTFRHFYVGTDRQQNFIFAGEEAYSPRMFDGDGGALASRKGEITSSTAYAFINLSRVISLLADDDLRGMPAQAKNLLRGLESIVFRAESPLKGEVRLEVEEKDQNILSWVMAAVNEAVEENM